MRASAKINLFLHVGAARGDGYHDVFSLVGFAGIGDDLTVGPTAHGDKDIHLAVEGEFAQALANEPVQDNLVVKAGRLLQDWAERSGRPVTGARITLTKNLPVAAGIGGGSADAACALKALAAVWSCMPDQQALDRIMLSLGADVPVCFANQASWMSGIGETVHPAPPLPPTAIVLINPRVPLSTGPVFRLFDDFAPPPRALQPRPLPDRFGSSADLLGFLQRQRNDLQSPAIRLCPEIKTVLSALQDSGAELVRMSGSGPTCFGLFSDPQAAREAKRVLLEQNTGWWIEQSVLL